MTTFIPSTPRLPASDAVRRAIRSLPLLAVAWSLGHAAMAAETSARGQAAGRTPAAKTVVDHSVRPAGGGCRECGPGGCRHGHHRDCRDGACVPYCPVRPGTFGFYGTQWRRWPGSGVVPVSNEQASTPVKPPRSAVPSADEESFGPPPSELPEPDFPAAAAPEPSAPEPAAVEPAPVEPAVTEPAAERPAAKPKGDDSLFDESAASKVRRKIPVTAGRQPASRAVTSRVQPVGHQQEAALRQAPKTTPRVAFDPRKEAEQVRQRQTR